MNTQLAEPSVSRKNDSGVPVSYSRRRTETPRPEELLKKGASELEPLRWRWLMWSLTTWTTFCVLAFLTLIVLAGASETPVAALVTGAVSLLIVYLFARMGRWYRDKLQDGFDHWRAEVFAFLENGAEFTANCHLSQADFDHSGLNSAVYNRFSGDNQLSFHGVRASNLAINHVYEETYYTTDSDGNRVAKTRTVVAPVFHGLMLIVDAPLPHAGTVVINDPGHGIGVLRKLQVTCPHLKKRYAIGADDPLVGHRVLTPSFQEALWGYRQEFKYLPRFAYRSGKLYVAIPGASLQAGKRPIRWLPVSITRLDRVLKQCEALLGFLHSSAEKLRPELDD